jgi:uncharacterized protein (DUF983 family)
MHWKKIKNDIRTRICPTCKGKLSLWKTKKLHKFICRKCERSWVTINPRSFVCRGKLFVFTLKRKTKIETRKQCYQCKRWKFKSKFWEKSKICRKCANKTHREYSKKNAEKVNNLARIYGEKRRRKNEKLWLLYLKKNPKCEICGEPLKYFSGREGVYFDHVLNSKLKIKINPSNWLQVRKTTSKNLKIWKSCNFGTLCINCNSRIPHRKRTYWLRRATKYNEKHSVSRTSL